MPKGLKPWFWSEKAQPDILKDYDAVGFDADNCFVKFNVIEMTRLVVEAFLHALLKDH